MLKIAFSFWEKEKYIHQHLLTSLISCRPKLLCRNLQTQILGGESRLESRRLLSYQYIYADITFMWVEHWDWKITVWVDIILNLSCDNFWYLDFVNNKWERRNKPGVSTDKGVQAEGSWGDLCQEEREQRGVDFREQQQDLQHQQRREWGTREWWVGKSILPYLWKSNTK